MAFYKKYRVHLIILAALTIIFSIGYCLSVIREKHLQRNYKTTKGIIDKVEIHKGTCLIFYHYTANYKQTSQNTQLFVDKIDVSDLEKLFVGKDNFMVAYDTLNISNSKLLLKIEEYKAFGVVPDSYAIEVFDKIDRFRIN